MFELMVSISSDKQMHIAEIYSSLAEIVEKDKGIIAKQNYAGRASVAIAVPESKKEYYKARILENISYIIIDDYKFNFYRENLQVFGENIICQSFLKAISIFDSEIDRDVIKNQIELKGEILIDSFYYFKLSALRSRWQKTANIINQNQILTSLNSMVGVLRYLIVTSESLSMHSEVLIGKKQIKLKGISSTKCFKRNFEGHSNFLTEIVRLNPVKIDVKLSGDGSEDQVVMLLGQIFSDKIYFVN